MRRWVKNKILIETVAHYLMFIYKNVFNQFEYFVADDLSKLSH